MIFGRCLCVLCVCSCVAVARAEPLKLHGVPLPVQSPRLLGMCMDSDGDIWLGSTHRKLYRFSPSSGAIDELALPATGDPTTFVTLFWNSIRKLAGALFRHSKWRALITRSLTT